MPVKLSGELVEQARKSAKLFHRSLTGQIEHWASIGRVIEAQLPGDTVAKLLEQMGGTIKIGQVADSAKRQEVMSVLAQFLSETTNNRTWLREISARGVPLHGIEAGMDVRLNPDGSCGGVQAGAAAVKAASPS